MRISFAVDTALNVVPYLPSIIQLSSCIFLPYADSRPMYIGQWNRCQAKNLIISATTPALMGGNYLSHFYGFVKWISQKKLWIKKRRPRRKERIPRSAYLERGFKKLLCFLSRLFKILLASNNWSPRSCQS